MTCSSFYPLVVESLYVSPSAVRLWRSLSTWRQYCGSRIAANSLDEGPSMYTYISWNHNTACTCTSFFFTQVAALNAKGVPACSVSISSDTKDRGQQERILRGQVKILYIGPELLMLPQWREMLDTSLQRNSGSLCNRRGLLHRLANQQK